MKNLLALILVLAIPLTACGPRSLEIGADNVQIKSSIAYLSKRCKFLGRIKGEDVHGDMSLSSLPQELMQDDIYFLKNEGKKLGANVVVIDEHTVVEKEIATGGKVQKTILIKTHNITADAYLCGSENMKIIRFLKERYPNNKICKCTLTI